jgi:peptidoglycan hydrolase-like protein with peptidoglycan-binding domain
MLSPDPDSRSARRRRSRPLALAAAGLALIAAGLAARLLWPGVARPAVGAAAVPVATGTVVRTTVSARQTITGTLGYQGLFSVVNELAAGIVTWVPQNGSVVRRGKVLYRVAGQPVVLLSGAVPAWRDFTPGMTPGTDVRELQRNLVALGFDPGHLITPDGEYDWATQAAVRRWQDANGMPVTGAIPLGEVTFLPGPLRVTTAAAPPGTPASVGAAVLTGTSDTPSVSVPLPVGGPAVQPGNPVLVTMPNGTTTVSGTVTSVGGVATIASAAQGTASSQPAPGTGGSPAAATIPVTITIRSRIPAGLDQAPVQVAITQQRHQNVLAVPVTALLALPGGGYAVRAAGPAQRLIPVTTGLFDDATGLVEVTGPGLAAGLKVTEAQG